MKFVVMKRGGEPGEVAINPERVTHVRASSGPFTDVHFGEHRIAVEGTLPQVIARLSGTDEISPQTSAAKAWLR